MSEQNSLLMTANRATLLGNRISLKMVQFLNEVKNQPAGFRDLGSDFLGICQILNSLEASLVEHFRSNQPFPQQAIPELTRILVKTLEDFTHLENLLQKFMDFERGGTFAMLQKTWRLVFADKDIAVIGGSLQENRGALKMTMLLTNINPTPSNVPAGYEYTMLATKLERHDHNSFPQNSPPAPPPASPSISELHSYEVSRPLPGPPPGPPPNWNQSKPPLPQRKPVAESVSTMSSRDPESPASPGILTPSISEMSISDRVPEPSSFPANETSEKEVQLVITEEKMLVEESTTSRDLLADQSSPPPPRKVHVDRSRLQFRIPKQSSAANNASLKAALISAVNAQKSKIVEQLLDRGVPPHTGPEQNALGIATYKNDLDILKLLLDFGGNPNLNDSEGKCPLRYACQYNYPAAAKLLLEFGGDPDLPQPTWSLLPWALDDSKEEIVRDLLLYGADPNLIMANGDCSLRYACEKVVKPHLVEELLNYGADPNLKSKGGETPLAVACYRNHIEIVRILLARGADPNLPGNDLPIKCALRNPKCMRLLVSAGADFKLSKGLMELAVYYNSIDAIKIMLDAGVDPNEKKENFYSPLTTSIRDNHPEITALLISRGADMHQKGEGFPLTAAIRKPAILRMLLAEGADVKTYQGLMEVAVYCNNLESVKILLEAGVPIDEKHNNCYTPLTTAIRDNRPEIVAFLLSHGADPNFKGEGTPLAMAVSKPPILKQLLEGGADITQFKGLIEHATYCNNLESVKILVEAGENINQKKSGIYTPLTTAIRDNRIEILSYILSQGADPNEPGEGIPLINASSHENQTRLKMLLEAGADVNKKNDFGKTALMVACERGFMENVNLLMKSGADIDAVDKSGKTPMDFAVHGGHDDIVMVLLDAMG